MNDPTPAEVAARLDTLTRMTVRGMASGTLRPRSMAITRRNPTLFNPDGTLTPLGRAVAARLGGGPRLAKTT